MRVSFLNDDLVETYRSCNDVDQLKKVILDCRNEIISLHLQIEKMQKDYSCMIRTSNA